MSWRAKLAIGAVVVDLLISGNLLTAIGSSYISEGGNLAEKIHPGSYIAILAGGICLASYAYRRTSLLPLISANTGVFVFLASLILCLAELFLLTGTGNLIALIDTYLPAGLLAVALIDATLAERRILRQAVQIIVMLNAILCVAEVATATHLVPLVSDDPGTDTEFRPTALYDHPLTGGIVTLLGLLAVPRSEKRPKLTAAYVCLAAVALVAFSERTPVLIGGVILAAILMMRLANLVVSRRAGTNDLALIGCCGALGLLLLAVASAGSVSDRLAAHLYWDSSAQVRVYEWHILSLLTPSELLFGCRREDLIALLEPLRLSYKVGVIENFWLLMLVTLGVAGFPVFLFGFASLMRWLWRNADRYGRIMIVALVVAASTSNSLGRKSNLLVVLVAAVMSAPAKPSSRTCLVETQVKWSIA